MSLSYNYSFDVAHITNWTWSYTERSRQRTSLPHWLGLQATRKKVVRAAIGILVITGSNSEHYCFWEKVVKRSKRCSRIWGFSGSDVDLRLHTTPSDFYTSTRKPELLHSVQVWFMAFWVSIFNQYVPILRGLDHTDGGNYRVLVLSSYVFGETKVVLFTTRVFRRYPNSIFKVEQTTKQRSFTKETAYFTGISWNPLITGGHDTDWNSVAQKLHRYQGSTEESAENNGKNQQRNRGWTWYVERMCRKLKEMTRKIRSEASTWVVRKELS